MGRLKVDVRRTEIRFRKDDPLLLALLEELALRGPGVELQDHIYDVLQARWLLQQGKTLHDALWMPGGTPAQSEPLPENEDEAPNDTSAQAAHAWLAMQD